MDECIKAVRYVLRQRLDFAKLWGRGDFEFDGLPEDTEYTVRIGATGYKPQELVAKTTIDVYLGDIVLTQ